MARRLRFADLPVEAPFHAALVTAGSLRSERFQPHSHDFMELLAVVSGEGVHASGQLQQSLEPGTMVLVRPDDVHEVGAVPGSQLQFINIAFPVPVWCSFVGAAGLDREFASWRSSREPPLVTPTGVTWRRCEEAFRAALLAYQYAPTPLDLVRFLAEAVQPLLCPATGGQPYEQLPDWLGSAMAWLADEDHLRAGVPGLLATANVSYGHLARTTRRYLAQTPTELVNSQRVARAAMLLATTTGSVSLVAHQCGFNSMSHFYRVFGEQYGQSPARYRLAASRAVIPRRGDS